MTPASRPVRIGGIMSAPVTPFREDYALNEPGLELNVASLVEGGADSLVPCGSIGEHPTLSQAEWVRVVEITVAAARGRVPVLATTGHTDWRIVRERVDAANTAGADGVVVTPPYYFPLAPSELVAYYRMVAACGMPFMAYSNPTTGGPTITAEVLAEIAVLPHFAGLKEATPNVVEFVRKREILGGRFPIIAAAETQLFFMLVAGADGCLTATSTFAPSFLRPMWEAVRRSDLTAARTEAARLAAFRRIVDAENARGRAGYLPVAKAAMELLGMAGGPPRPPIEPLGAPARAQLADVMATMMGLPVMQQAATES